MIREETKLLPVVEWGGRELLVDVDARQFRNVDDARDFIDMHSPQGRAIVASMQNETWRVYGVDSGPKRDVAV